ncbi:Ring finger protein [Seminavis robusta]|uniref:Ring finger protein n=1 Tax=Seminavis robusta TaxID=568900 RepID=A0A9N8DZD6_9STRA|nr:Ring finger protein [Seminavis robusta]|eukprot:Sro498_g154920.1 Ring finger protein (5164) ;mRNA; r:21553-37708
METTTTKYQLTIGRYKFSYSDGKVPLETKVVVADSSVPFPGLDTTARYSKFDMVRPKFWEEKIDGVSYPTAFMDDVRSLVGKVCIYDGEHVDLVVEAANKAQMTALIVVKPVSVQPTLPVFHLDKDLVDLVLAWGEGAKVIVQPAAIVPEASDPEEESSPNPSPKGCDELAFGQSANSTQGSGAGDDTTNKHGTKRLYSEAAKASGEPPYIQMGQTNQVELSHSKAQKTGTGSPIKKTRSSEDKDEEEDDEAMSSSEEEDDSDEAPEKNKKGFVETAWNKVTNVLGITYDDELLTNSAKWNASEKYSGYQEAMKLLDGMEPDGGQAKAFVKRMPQFLGIRAGGNRLVKLAFACRLWMVVKCQGREELLRNILRVIRDFDFAKRKADVTMEKYFREDHEKPHGVFRLFFVELVKQPDLRKLEFSSKLWTNILWLWLKCGLLKSPIDWESWSRLRYSLGPNFWKQHKNQLTEVLKPARYHTLVLFLEARPGAIKEMHAAILELKETRFLRVEIAISEMLKDCGCRIISTNSSDVTEELCTLLEALLQLCFLNHDAKRVRGEIISSLVSHSNFQNNGHFSKYNSIVEGVERLDDRQIENSVRYHIRRSLIDDLKRTNKRPWARDIEQLLDYPWAMHYLGDKSGLEELVTFMQEALELRSTPLLDKLVLLDTLQNFAGETRLLGTRALATFQKSLRLHSRRDIVEQTCNVLEGGFMQDSSQGFENVISTLIVDAVTNETGAIFQDLATFQDAIGRIEKVRDNGFARYFAAGLTQALVSACDSMESASLVFLRLIERGNEMQSLSLASRLFCESFPSWQPHSLDEVALENKRAWELIFQCFAVVDTHRGRAPDVVDRVFCCKDSLVKVFEDWTGDFRSRQITLAGLDTGLACSKLETWSLISRHLKLEMPDSAEIREMVEQGERLVESIRNVLVAPVEWGRSLRDLFVAYDCHTENDHTCAALFGTFSQFVETRPPLHDSQLSPHDERLREIQLQALKSHKDAAEGFSQGCMNALRICAHFSRHRSVLFQQRFSRIAQGGCGGVNDLRRCVEQAVGGILGLFSEEASFSDVRLAIVELESHTVTVQQEVSNIAGCEALKFDDVMCDRFLLSALVCRLTRPLADFVSFCTQFGFEVETDECFDVIKDTIEEIQGQDQIGGSRSQCERLYKHLVMTDNKTAPITHDLADLERYIPLLKLFSCLRRHHEIWSLAAEKQWFGSEGLGNFLRELDHLSNTHMDSYNTTVLEVIEPLIRIISIIGDHRKQSKVTALFNSLVSNQHVQEWLRDGRFKQFNVVQQNLGQVRRWFCEEENEIHGYYRVFQEISGGRYFISLHEKELGIEYKGKDGIVADMSGNEIEALLGQLSNIQHDDSIIAAAIDCFAEQHAIIEQAAAFVLKMESSGFRDSGIEDFTCQVGEQHMEDARTLHQACRQRSDVCTNWLQETRRYHPLSLLFWDEELKELHKQLSLEDDAGLSMAVHTLSRLLPSQNVSQVDMDNLGAIVSGRSMRAASESWLLEVSRFIEDIHKALGEPQRLSVEGVERELVVHSLSCDKDLRDEVLLGVLQSIYKNRLPGDAEILDGHSPSFEERLPLFLERAKEFPSCTFTILVPEQVKKKGPLAKIRSFFSSKAAASGNLRFHCVQFESLLAPASPFYVHRVWSNESRDSMTPTLNLTWKHQVVGNNTAVVEATVVVSDFCCAGKTRYIRDEQQRLSGSSDGSIETGTITVHEKSNADTLIASLASKFSHVDGHKLLHVSVLAIPVESDSRALWFQQLRKFFFQFLVLGVLHYSDSKSHYSFYVGRGRWRLHVELPSSEVRSDNGEEWLRRNIPLLSLVCQIKSPTNQFLIDNDARNVCKYLRACEDGSIDDVFDPETNKQVIFVIDQSESMEYEVSQNKTQLSAAIDYALMMFDSHAQVGDHVGVTMFNHQHKHAVPTVPIRDEAHKGQLREQINGTRNDIPLGGGTHMFSALSSVIERVERGEPVPTWIVCLTDGDSDDTEEPLRQQLQQSRRNLHLVVVGVNLFPDYEQRMRLLCQKYSNRRSKGFYVGSNSTLDSMEAAFKRVQQGIPVSQTFDLLGEPTDDECRALIELYAPKNLNMLTLNFWVKFLHRRITVMNKNESFNFNQTKVGLGGTLMKLMFDEVKRLLESDQQKDWLETNYSQLIYDFSDPENPQFRLLCTSPNSMPEALKREYERLELPGFTVPKERDLAKRTTLDRLISQAMGIPLDGVPGQERLRCIDDSGFILTRDFGVKLLNIHERVAAGVPCIMEGESGVSKTALSKEYSILVNSALTAEASRSTAASLKAIEEEAISNGYSMGDGPSPEARLAGALEQSRGMAERTQLSNWLHAKIKAVCGDRSAIFQPMPQELDNNELKTVVELVQWLASSNLNSFFFEINIHSSMEESDIVARFEPVRRLARKIPEVPIVVFLDEVNTASMMGLFKEIIVDCSLQGDRLETNIITIAACNPARSNLMIETNNAREVDMGRTWCSGHYQVSPLPTSMSALKWCFGALSKTQEREFIFRRLRGLGSVPLRLQMTLTEVISLSQEAMREFASKDIKRTLRRTGKYSDAEIEDEAKTRSQSVVSLRDIQRVFSLYDFFFTDFPMTEAIAGSKKERSAMLLAVAVVYLLRLDSASRTDYLERLKNLAGEQNEMLHLDDILSETLEDVTKHTNIKDGVARTRGLQESLFMTLCCTMSGTPLLVVGPPGCSKTLSVNAVGDNAQGEESLSPLFKRFPRLSYFNYQCSKLSTSTEVEGVFGKATRRQTMVDRKTNICVVFLDEAGLPEERRESLKVLHYLLESHMSVNGAVSFVSISNHVLDAAKSNRCAMLFREEPDDEEMLTMTKGVLYGSNMDGSLIHNVDLDGSLTEAHEFGLGLCRSYSAMRNIQGLDTFFGLRDYIYFLKYLRTQSSVRGGKLVLTIGGIMSSLSRNFNGVELEKWKHVAFESLRHVVQHSESVLSDFLDKQAPCPMRVIHDVLSPDELCLNSASRGRFKLIIDCSEDDSIMRLLSSAGLLDLSKKTLFKISSLPDEKESEKLRVISGVKFAAMQGHTVLLSNTESIDESFYDLQNQNFREIENLDGSVSLYANIAMGGVSRRCQVHPSFSCIVHVRAGLLDQTPAPFLNRFEKYRLDISDFVSAGWASLGKLEGILQRSRQRAAQLVGLLGKHGLVGFNNRTLDSAYAGLLPAWTFSNLHKTEHPPLVFNTESSFIGSLTTFIGHVTTMGSIQERVKKTVDKASNSFPTDECNVLQELMTDAAGMERVHETLSALLHVDANKDNDENMEQSNPIEDVCSNIIQMVFTEYVVSVLLQVAVPEAVYAKRNVLPQFLTEAYFAEQEHFSLKLFLEKAMEKEDPQLLIIHTRTDANVHSIPSFNTSEDLPGSHQSSRAIVRQLVCADDKSVVCEHMDSLPSESSFRKAVTDWIQGTKRVFLLLVDMSGTNATDNVNYIRMCIEQNSLGGKIFLLLLHYPSSSSLSSSCYPVLFLGQWRHTVLDVVGQSGPPLALSESIRLACGGILGDKKERPHDKLVAALSQMMPTVLSHLASKNRLLYRGQDLGRASCDQGTFLSRWNFLKDVLSTQLEDGNVGDSLCQKFVTFWFDQGLETTVRMACIRLQRGTTQLSLSASIQSALLEALHKFMATSMKAINTWRNADLLGSGNKEVLSLYGTILRKLPVPPFAELMLLQENSTQVRPMPSVMDSPTGSFVQFPFFYDISNSVEETMEMSAGLLAENASGNISHRALYTSTMKELSNKANRSEGNSTRAVVESVVNSVADSDELFERYLRQFIAWKTGIQANPYIMTWLVDAVEKMRGDCSLVAVHCFARCFKIDLMKAASWSIAAVRNPRLCPEAEGDIKELSQWPMHLLMHSLQRLQDTVTAGVADKDRDAWCSDFSALLNHCSVVDHVNDEIACRIRILHIFNVLFRLPTRNTEIEATVLERFWARQATQVQTPSLAVLFDLIDGSRSLEEAVLWQFFSPSGMAAKEEFFVEDFSTLLDLLEEGKLQHHSHQWKVSLLRRACTVIGGQDKGIASNQQLGLPLAALRILNAKVALVCEPAVFSEGGTRRTFPHYVPQWLRHEDDLENGKDGSERHGFFSNYKHSFTGILAEVAFDMVLGILLRRNFDSSSVHMLQVLQVSISEEEQLTQQDHVRLSRSQRGHMGDPSRNESLVGTALAAMIADALTICFVAALARDIAVESEGGLALQEPYDEICKPILEQIMSIPQVSFVDFFFSLLIRRSESRLMNLLGAGGLLHDLDFTLPMRQGMPAVVANQRTTLQNAEAALQEALEDEQRKSQDLKTCPHQDCRRPFAVLVRACGQFTCGRDYHTAIGSEGAYGCGRNFQVDTAPNYRVDEERLAPLRRNVEAQRAQLASLQRGATSWRRAREFEVPQYLFFVERAPSGPSLVPSVAILETCSDTDDASKVVRVFLNGAKLVEQLDLLPDLIELYLWLHSVFGQILSKAEALERAMGDVMEESRLLRRFDSIHARHMTSLWGRVVKGANQLLEQMDNKALWNCTEIDIPFTRIEGAAIFALLSEGSDPLDGGCDFLFLMINEIVTKYNRYVQQLSELKLPGTLRNEFVDRVIHPKFLMAGSGGAAVINRSTAMSSLELDTLVESVWNRDLAAFEPNRLVQSLAVEASLCQSPPAILNPLRHLREEFVFRTDRKSQGAKDTDCADIFRDLVDGTHFAREQDLRLVCDVREELHAALGDNANDSSIRPALCSELHKELDSHQKTIGFLGGLRNLLGLFSPDSRDGAGQFEEALGGVGGSNRASSTQPSRNEQMKEIGFPDLSPSTMDILLALNKPQIVELVRFLNFHLASEGYLYSDLPVYLVDPLSREAILAMVASMQDFCEENGVQRALSCLKEFVGDVLILYENLLVEEAGLHTKSLKEYLQENNFCGTEDPIFVLLPNEIHLQNYVSLRQHLQQAELSLQHQLLASSTVEGQDLHREYHSEASGCCRLSAGECLLWQPEGEIVVEPLPIRNTKGGLWFLDCPTIDVASDRAKHAGASTVIDDDALARRIQRWWRRIKQSRNPFRMDIEMQGEEEFYDTLSHEDEMEEDEEEFFDYDEEGIPMDDNQVEAVGEDVAENGEAKAIDALANPAPPTISAMEEWLEQHKLPRKVIEDLIELGATTIEDVKMVVEDEEMIGAFKKLDQKKLRMAVKNL